MFLSYKCKLVIKTQFTAIQPPPKAPGAYYTMGKLLFYPDFIYTSDNTTKSIMVFFFNKIIFKKNRQSDCVEAAKVVAAKNKSKFQIKNLYMGI